MDVKPDPISDQALADTLALAAVKLPRTLRALDKAPQLTPTEASALAVLFHGGSLNIGHLAAHEGVKPPSMTRTVQLLERRGLVRRDVDPEDARGSRISLTPAGRKVFVTGHRRRLAPLVRWLAQLPAARRAALVAALPVLDDMATLRAPGKS